MCMARVNIYLPDDLAERAREAGVNVSAVARSAIEAKMASMINEAVFEELARLPRPRRQISHEEVIATLDAVRAEADRDWDEHFGFTRD